ncbi:MAG: hypothetical protein D6820_11815, partial [Lentisphaerae bacterium]
VWFRAGVLSWSSHRTWAVFNTLDGRWNKENGTWKGRTGTDGIYLHEGRPNRHTRWGALPEQHAVINNIILGCPVAVDKAGWTEGSICAGNITEPAARDRSIPKVPIRFHAPDKFDYRPMPELLPVFRRYAFSNAITQHVKHDFYGLLRFPDFPSLGACRLDPIPRDPRQVRIEFELKSGEMFRLYGVKPTTP